jgi:DhnA family fructose-bisphosphate aldolase class Ia
MDWLILDQHLEELGEQYRVLCTPQDAASLGAGAVVMYLILGVEEGAMFADNARAVAGAAREAHLAGLPLIVETVLWGSRISDRRDPDLLAFGCRMAAELGADAIKTEYTGDPETFAPIVEGCPVPVLTLGGPQVDSEEALVETPRGAMEAGAKGVVYGRNIWQADDPVRISGAVREIVHGAYARG